MVWQWQHTKVIDQFVYANISVKENISLMDIALCVHIKVMWTKYVSWNLVAGQMNIKIEHVDPARLFSRSTSPFPKTSQSVSQPVNWLIVISKKMAAEYFLESLLNIKEMQVCSA